MGKRSHLNHYYESEALEVASRASRHGARRDIRRAILASAVAVASVLGFSACGSSSSESGNSSAIPVSGGKLVINEAADTIGCVDPFQTAWTATRSVVRNVAESLVDQDPKTGDIKPWLAKSWTISGDGLTYTFKLKSGITFSNGEKFNADAVVTNFEGDLKTLKENPGTVGGFYVQYLASVTKVDDDTVQFHLSKPDGSFLQGLATPTLAVIAPASFKNTAVERCGGSYYGTGPFTITKYDVNTSTVLTRRKGYTSPSPFASHRGDAYLKSVEIDYVPESSVRIGNLKSGNADIIWTTSDSQLTQNDIAQIKAAGGSVKSRSLPGSAFDLMPNVRAASSPLSDLSVRQAFSYAIDRKTYASTNIRSGYPVVSSVVDSTTPGYKKLAAVTTYNVEKADSLLTKAGWKLNKKDGYRYKNGKKLTLHLLTTSSDNGYELIQDEVKKVGIELKIDVVTSAQYTTKTNANDYDLVSITYTRSDPSAINTLLDVRYATFKAISGNTQTDADQKWLEDAFDRAAAQTDESKREAVYGEIQDYLAEHVTAIPVYERVQDAGLSPRVHGLRFTAESFSDLYNVYLSD